MSTDWLITGIPRSGTTLLAALIDSMPDSVCLNEPLWQQDLAKSSASAPLFAQKLVDDSLHLRQMLQAGRSVPDLRRGDGTPVTNYLDDQGRVIIHPAAFSRSNLSANFTLAIKHNGLFLGVLPALIQCQKFNIIALIRSPIEVLASWRTSMLPVSRGELPAACYFWPELAALQRVPMDLLDRQLHLLDMLYRRIHEQEKYITLLRYESLVNDPAQLAAIIGKSPASNHIAIPSIPVKSMDIPVDLVRKKLKDIGHYTRYYYPDF